MYVSLWLLASLVCSLWAVTMGNPGGPPLVSCHTMRPGTTMGFDGPIGHTEPPQNEFPGPYRPPSYYFHIHGNHSTYAPNEQFSISVIADQRYSSNYYKGLLMQAREVRCSYYDEVDERLHIEVYEEALGTFSLPSSATQTLLQTLDCFERERSAVGHRSPQYKTNETVTWSAPENFQGHIVFRGTFVHHATYYWTDVYSDILADPSGRRLPVCKVTNSGDVITSRWSLTACMCLVLYAVLFH